jgi:TolB-like protein/tetratricopeptide (TPR) repeat protein
MAPTIDNPDRNAAAGPGSLPPDEVRDQLERILSDPALQGSSRRRDLLRYLVDETLAGRADHLKGYSIAIAIFGRQDGFDAGSDPVVRLEARRLRRDLDSYYAGAGAGDPIRIAIAKGAYVPSFERRGQAPVGHDPRLADVAPSAQTPLVVDPAERAAGRSRVVRRALAAVALLAVVSFAISGWFWIVRASAPVETAHGPSVMVLPFEALSSSEEDQFLAAGVSQDLIADLMRFDGFRLYSVRASFGQDAAADPLALGQDLEVDYVVKGNVSSDSTTVRMGAQLFDADSGAVIWSQTYDRAPSAGGLLALRSEFAASIASVLGQPYGKLNSDMAVRLAGGAEPSMSSYACVLKAHTYRRTFRDELRPPVLACLEAATERDPDYAEPWALLGWLHLDAARYGFVPDDQVAGEMAQALGLASRAVAVEPENVLALRALSAVQYHLGNFDESERIQRQALALNPNDPDTLAQLAWRLCYRGRWEEGLAYAERAIARTVDPPGWYYDPITIHLYLEGRYREMLVSAERTATGDSQGMAFLAIAYGALGDHAAAQQALATVAEQAPGFYRDPAGAFRRFEPLESIVIALMDGLRKAGWNEPTADPAP